MVVPNLKFTSVCSRAGNTRRVLVHPVGSVTLKLADKIVADFRCNIFYVNTTERLDGIPPLKQRLFMVFGYFNASLFRRQICSLYQEVDACCNFSRLTLGMFACVVRSLEKYRMLSAVATVRWL